MYDFIFGKTPTRFFWKTQHYSTRRTAVKGFSRIFAPIGQNLRLVALAAPCEPGGQTDFHEKIRTGILDKTRAAGPAHPSTSGIFPA